MQNPITLFGPVSECLLLREERKSGLGGPTSELDPTTDIGARLRLNQEDQAPARCRVRLVG